MNEVVEVSFSDEQRAAQLKERMAVALGPVLAILIEGRKAGLVIGFNVTFNPATGQDVVNLTAAKYF